MPQVHGTVRDALAHARDIVEIETGSATDNPLVFTDTGEVISGGNFHGAPLALAFDYAAMALTDLMSITERRIDRLVNPDANEDLPPFLTTQAGSASGCMMLQIVAASLLNEARVLAHPSSIDNVPTDGGKEDHVSMGMTGAIKLRAIVELSEMMTAIELIAAAQGLEYRAPLRAGRGVERARAVVRKFVAPLTSDRAMSAEVEELARQIRDEEFDAS
jgi:histidine ammonia-lyase